MSRRRRRQLRALVTGALATVLALTSPAGATLPAPTSRTTVTIAAASALAPGTIVTVAGSDGWGPSAATNTAMHARALARGGTTLYVADEGVVRAVDLTTGVQRVIAGTGAGVSAGDGGPATAASFTAINAVAVDAAGVLYVTDVGPSSGPGTVSSISVRRIGLDGVITTLPGTPPGALISSLAPSADGALLVGDERGFVHKVANGTATIVAGTATPSPFNGDGEGQPATEAPLGQVFGVTEAPDGQLYLSTAKVLRRVDAGGIIHTVADVWGRVSHKADGHIIVTAPHGVVLVSPAGSITPVAGVPDPSGPLPRFYFAGVADAEDRLLLASMPFDRSSGGYSLVERIEPDGVVTRIAGTGTPLGGAGGPAGLTQFAASDVEALPDGSLVLLTNDELWRISRDGTASVLVPRAILAPAPPDPTGYSASALTVDARGTMYAAVGAVVWRVDAAGTVSVVAGTGSTALTGDGGPALEAGLGFITDIAAGASGDVFLSDAYDGVIRRVATDGTITTIAGSARDRADFPNFKDARQTGDGGAAADATLVRPSLLAVDHAGNLYVMDGTFDPRAQSGAVRRIGTDGVISRVIAEGADRPIEAIAFDSADNLLFAIGPRRTPAAVRTCACQVLRRKAHGLVEVVAGRDADFAPLTSTGDGGPARDATLVATRITVDASNNLFLLDAEGTRVREVVAIGAPTAIEAAPPAAPVVAAAPLTG